MEIIIAFIVYLVIIGGACLYDDYVVRKTFKVNEDGDTICPNCIERP